MELLILEQELNRLYQTSAGKFMDRWRLGLYDHILKQNPALSAQINAAWDNLNDIWISIRNGNAGIPIFINALKTWESLHLKALDQ